MSVYQILNEEGQVVNTIVANEQFVKENYECYKKVSDLRVSPSRDSVDSERNRRISDGFIFEGVLYQSRLPSQDHPGDWDVFSGKALEAFISVSQGAEIGDLRWSDKNSDFMWISADNTLIPMDAQTTLALCKEASNHRTKITMKASHLKSMEEIPLDFKDDKWWV